MAHIPGCKLPRRLENPIDDLIMVAVEPWLEPLYQAGVTPNMVTWASAAASAGSVAMCFLGRPNAAAALWLLNYTCDTVDGFLARRYRMETRYGDRLDHASDALAFCGLMTFVVSRLRARPWWPLAVEGLLLATSWYNFHCQEAGSQYFPIEQVDGTACFDREHLRVTRWLGMGTLLLWHLFLIYFYRVQPQMFSTV